MAGSFSIDDIRLLEKTISIRERMIDNIIKQENLPTKPREVDSFTNLLESVDRSIFAKAKIKIDDSNSRVNEETKEIMKDLLLNLHKNQSPASVEPKHEAPVFQPTGRQVKEGEIIPKQDTADISKYMESAPEA